MGALAADDTWRKAQHDCNTNPARLTLDNDEETGRKATSVEELSVENEVRELRTDDGDMLQSQSQNDQYVEDNETGEGQISNEDDRTPKNAMSNSEGVGALEDGHEDSSEDGDIGDIVALEPFASEDLALPENGQKRAVDSESHGNENVDEKGEDPHPESALDSEEELRG